MATKTQLMIIVVVVVLLAYSGMYIFGDTIREMEMIGSDKQQNNMSDIVLSSNTSADKDIVLSSNTTADKYVVLSSSTTADKDIVLSSSTTGISSQLYRGHGNYSLKSPNARSWSQYGQDIYITEHFNGRRGGFFVEIGGYDGQYLSNTILLEKQYNWTGLLIEANTELFPLMKKTDRNCYMINCCIGKEGSNMTFLLSDVLSSSYETLTPQHRNRILRVNPKGTKELSVVCHTLQNIMKEIGQSRIDYFSLDVEGAELFILNSIDWETLFIDVFTIETDQHRTEIIAFMEDHGYERIAKLKGDDVFKRKSK